MKKPLFFYSLFVLTATLFLIMAGGLVTSHEAGLAVPDWPKSYGQWFPPMVGNVFWEHGHRMIAGSVGIFTLILTVWVHVSVKHKGLRLLARIALYSVILQAILGGLTVVYLLPPAVSIAHACLAQTFLCLLTALTYFLRPQADRVMTFGEKPGVEIQAQLKRLLVFTFVIIYLQLILGAMVRHTGRAIPVHVLLAFFVLLHGVLVMVKLNAALPVKHPAAKIAVIFGAMIVIQIFLGLGSFIFTRMMERGYSPALGEVIFTVAHQTTGAAILATALLLTIMVYDGFRTRT